MQASRPRRSRNDRARPPRRSQCAGLGRREQPIGCHGIEHADAGAAQFQQRPPALFVEPVPDDGRVLPWSDDGRPAGVKDMGTAAV